MHEKNERTCQQQQQEKHTKKVAEWREVRSKKHLQTQEPAREIYGPDLLHAVTSTVGINQDAPL